ncbi:hypothetical protein Nepgr_003636 [Nepenthes gracilis]|uniref:Carbohydrate kinase PfkB domain-containing protein n=1 Tax=Nepenthes gracilis TaxID=150966 RepID=A0AAD3XDZ6_NEPGR|nr:hypothetical protein Nepgr_003636 [Nepenthes gracilis]
MSSLSLTGLFSLPRWNSNLAYLSTAPGVQVLDYRLQSRWLFSATSKNTMVMSADEATAAEGAAATKTTGKTRKTASRGRKKETVAAQEDHSDSVASNGIQLEMGWPQTAAEDHQKPKRRTRKKAVSGSTGMDEEKTEKKSRRGRKTKKKDDKVANQGTEVEAIDIPRGICFGSEDDGNDIDVEMEKDEDDDISCTYGWPPLVCCFGAAQHAFVPSGRPANRLIDHDIHETMKDAYWTPDKFVRSPGGSAGSVAIALASLGGKVAFMGKLGDDEYGQTMLYYLNVNNVQTRSVHLDSKRSTAVSQMKIGNRGGLRMTNVKPCAEDSLLQSEINIDVLREARMFYLNTSSLLDRSMRKTTLQAIKISKKFGGVIFYDLNLPFPLWQSHEETKTFIQQVWNLANVIEVTKQELEFLCGIEPSEKFDTKDNDTSKFVHYEPDVLAPLWHEHLEVLFVTNGTSKIHYYTKDHDGSVLGMEDAPITPFTCDMSASGDGIAAALMRMLSVQPHLIADKGYLERSIKYAITCGVSSQWILGRQLGFPPKEGMEEDVDPDQDGIISITERQYRTVVHAS